MTAVSLNKEEETLSLVAFYFPRFPHTLPHSLTLFLSLSFTPFTLFSHFKRPLGNIAPLGGGGVEVYETVSQQKGVHH